MIKVSELAAKVREIATANPDVTYFDIYREKFADTESLCMYQLDGEPGCLVGQAMFELGLDPETIKEFDDLNSFGSEAIRAVVYLRDDVFELDDADELEFLSYAQSAQDEGQTWGEAINQ